MAQLSCVVEDCPRTLILGTLMLLVGLEEGHHACKKTHPSNHYQGAIG